MSENHSAIGGASELVPSRAPSPLDGSGPQCLERRSPTRPLVVPGWRKTLPARRSCPRSELPGEQREPVEIWIARTDSILKSRSSLQLLTDEDWRYLGRLKVAAARHSAMAARVLLRLALSHLTEHRVPPREWTFRRTVNGKPILLDRTDINFSVTHVDEIAAVAVTAGPGLGIDIESVDQDLSGSHLATFLHPSEHAALEMLRGPCKSREAIRLWTTKEAYTKLLGLGHELEFARLNLMDGSIRDDAAAGAAGVILEGFYASFGYALYHAALAIDAAGNAAPLELQIVNVVAPGERGEVWCAPIC
jgi:4'-phosphopantetheinyl transferase